jgi:hypothetical protein
MLKPKIGRHLPHGHPLQQGQVNPVSVGMTANMARSFPASHASLSLTAILPTLILPGAMDARTAHLALARLIDGDPVGQGGPFPVRIPPPLLFPVFPPLTIVPESVMVSTDLLLFLSPGVHL